jgi:hypothetical protein
MKTKISLLVFILILCCSPAMAQLYIAGKNVNDSLHIKILELGAIDNYWYGGASKTTWYDVKYGQTTEMKQLTDSTGKRLNFTYSVDVANYIANKGWRLATVTYFMFKDAPYYKFFFTRIEN